MSARKNLILIIAALLLAGACKKDDIQPVTNTSGETKANEALYSLMKEWYLWYDKLPVVKASDYKDPYELMVDLRYKQYDRWSFVADYASFVASMQGTFVGHGIRMGLDNDNKVRIVTIYKNSPLYPLGVRRGWIVKKLNNTDLAAVFLSGDANAYNQLIGPSTAGVTNTFVFVTPEGKDSTITTTKQSFTLNSVLVDTVLNLSSGKTGYLVFDEFIEPSSNELKASFAKFKQEDVKDLILDLRYNTGGILSVATELASYISGQSPSSILIKMLFNDLKSSENQTTYFKTMLYPLNLSRLVVICTRETASASEVVINGLRPYLNVVLVGDTTNGKPTGMNVWTYPGTVPKYVYAPVTFKLVNKDNFGDFYTGLPPQKLADDDIKHNWGDPAEASFSQAVYYMENGTFGAKGSYTGKRVQYFRERPGLMNNAYIINR
ncbi:MAG TPA: S41 family peptidase [Bacteroidales bacterium]|nr:S41 family peptidase [Bacteroidales bacterium]HRR93012.1 S41 family peptidase [Bacteroidales bacterium]HRT89556.1 S41 family peptidase [Bacteroidales bacterium]